MRKMILVLALLLALSSMVIAQDCFKGPYLFTLGGKNFTASADAFAGEAKPDGCGLQDFAAEVVAGGLAFTVASSEVPVTDMGIFTYSGSQVAARIVFEAKDGDAPGGALDLYEILADGTLSKVSSFSVAGAKAGTTSTVDITYNVPDGLPSGLIFFVSNFGTTTEYLYAAYTPAGTALPGTLANAPQTIKDLWSAGGLVPVPKDTPEYDGVVDDYDTIFDPTADEPKPEVYVGTVNGDTYHVITTNGTTTVIDRRAGGAVANFIKVAKDPTAEAVYGRLILSRGEGSIVLASVTNLADYQQVFPADEFDYLTEGQAGGDFLSQLSLAFANPIQWLGNLWNAFWAMLFG